MKLSASFLSLAACALLAGGSLSAQEQLVVYDFTTDLNPTSWNESLLTAAAKTISFSGYKTTYTPDGTRSAGAGDNGGNIYARVGNMGSDQTTASRFSFTLTPQEGQSLDLGSISFDVGYQNISTGPHPSYTLHYQVGVTVGGEETLLPGVFTYNVLSSSVGTSGGYLGASPTVNTTATFDLSAFENVSSSITFTLYVYATNIGSGTSNGTLSANHTARIDNIVVATAAIPEPSTLALLMGGAAGLVLIVRRRMRRASGLKPVS